MLSLATQNARKARKHLWRERIRRWEWCSSMGRPQLKVVFRSAKVECEASPFAITWRSGSACKSLFLAMVA